MISVTDTSFHVVDLETRLPFHFGPVEVTAIPKLFLRADAAVDGSIHRGLAMGGLIPGWFFKDPSMDVESGYRRMIEVFRTAADAAREHPPESTPFEFWRAVYETQRRWAAGTDHPPLLSTYGVSLVEQALLDAVCRAHGVAFERAVRENILGIDLGSVYEELAPYEPADLLPAEPNRSTAIRHTVGLDDPLTDAEVTDGRPDDGLPWTLAEYVREDGVHHFKIKLSADGERDASRLARIADLLAELGVDYRCTVDANEGYDSAAAFRRQWETLATDPALDDLFDRLAYVEQPLPRDEAFTPETRDAFTEWDDAPPIVVDESDAEVDDAGTALSHGYAGTSHKNCKGVFSGLVNACLIAHRNRIDDGREYVLSAEDLTTVGPVELLQDLAVTATIGAGHVERNGHHYFRGLRAFPEDVQEAVLAAHGDLYRRTEEGFPTLDIDQGTVELGTIVDAPFGVACPLDVSRFTPLDTWVSERVE